MWRGGGAISALPKRTVAPVQRVLEEFGDMMLLAGRTVTATVRPPYPYGGELVNQFLFVLRLVWLSLLISTVAIDYGAPGLQAVNFLTLFGATDRLGGFFVIEVVREIGPLITAIVVAGVGGTAITAGPGGAR